MSVKTNGDRRCSWQKVGRGEKNSSYYNEALGVQNLLDTVINIDEAQAQEEDAIALRFSTVKGFQEHGESRQHTQDDVIGQPFGERVFDCCFKGKREQQPRDAIDSRRVVLGRETERLEPADEVRSNQAYHEPQTPVYDRREQTGEPQSTPAFHQPEVAGSHNPLLPDDEVPKTGAPARLSKKKKRLLRAQLDAAGWIV
ncbi:hypothetical protein BKA70DRAFT_1532758 [Coprinopsis sp. MPI-PUGE-AT-0042]|nr:hypothetical protein BKA70DRAFT_1532758 [Coprinopsis sp. MPI-PUGE-AT-0042]